MTPVLNMEHVYSQSKKKSK